MEEISQIKKRILQYIDYKNITKQKFCKKTGISYGNMRGKSLKSEIGGSQIAEILREFAEISPDWLLLGKGEMLRKGPSKAEEPPEPNKKEEKCEQCKQCAEKDKLIQTLQSAINVQNKYIECLEDKNSGACEKKSKKDTTTIPYISNNI